MIELNDKNYEQEVKNSDMPVIIDFWAEWCAPCKKLGVLLDSIDLNNIKVCKVDIDNGDGLIADYNVTNIPCLVMVRNGKEVARSVGFIDSEQLKEWINANG